MKKITIILFLWCGLLYAQHPMSIQLTQRDGLPDIEFYDIIEDNKGFIWFACDKGLYRYDGNEFKNYTHPEKKGLSVFYLQFDNQNRLWCTNLSGQFFYLENDKLHLFFDASKELKKEVLHRFTIYDNSLVAYGNSSCFKIDFKGNAPLLLEKDDVYFYQSDGVVKNDTLFLLRNGDNKFNTTIRYLTKGQLKLKNYISFYVDTLGLGNSHNKIYKTSENKLIYEQNNLKNSFRGEILKDTILKLPSLPIKKFRKLHEFFLDNGRTWQITSIGIYVFKESEVSTDFNVYFPSKSTSKVAKDKEDNYWVSTLHDGVFVIPNLYLNAYDLRKDIGKVTAIENVNNTHIYFGTSVGWIGIYDIKNKKIDYIQLTTEGSKVRHILYNEKLKDIYISHNFPLGSYIINHQTKRVNHINKKGLYGNAKSMIFLKDSVLFTSNLRTHALIKPLKVNLDNKKRIDLRNKRVCNTFSDIIDETIYVANIDELVAYDYNFKPTFIRYNNNSILARGITQTKDGTIWVSTFKDGILGIRNKKVIKSYTTKNGLLSNQTSYIKADGNNIWVTTQKGLQFLNTKTNIIKSITQKDGVESFNINGIEIIDNTVWFSSDLGLFSFDKHKVFKTQKIIDPYFTSVTIADSTYAVKPSYIIKHNDKRIAIQFNTNQFQTAKNTRYEYKLEGFQDKWKQLSKGTNEVVFNSLEQGSYIFNLRTLSGKHYSNVKKIKLKVQGVFYKQWWFILLVSLLVFSYIIFYYKQRLNQQEKEQKLALEKQQNKVEKTLLKLENLRSQMNPHFVFNALNSIQDYIIHNQKYLAGDYLGKFADLIRMYLDQSSKKEISLFEEIDTLKRYLELEKLRFEDKLEYQLLIDESIDVDAIFIPTMLLQPYIENSLKHGLLHKRGIGNLVISFKINKARNILTCVIIDDGVGRKKSKIMKQESVVKHKSFATKATQERLDLLNYNRTRKISILIEDFIKVENTEDCGTKVTIKIPV